MKKAYRQSLYMCGSDLESENGLASGDIEEMIAGSQSENVKFVIQTGGAGYQIC